MWAIVAAASRILEVPETELGGTMYQGDVGVRSIMLKYIEQLKSCKYIQDDRAVKKLCEKAKELLTKEENIIYLNAPITVRKIKYI